MKHQKQDLEVLKGICSDVGHIQNKIIDFYLSKSDFDCSKVRERRAVERIKQYLKGTYKEINCTNSMFERIVNFCKMVRDNRRLSVPIDKFVEKTDFYQEKEVTSTVREVHEEKQNVVRTKVDYIERVVRTPIVEQRRDELTSAETRLIKSFDSNKFEKDQKRKYNEFVEDFKAYKQYLQEEDALKAETDVRKKMRMISYSRVEQIKTLKSMHGEKIEHDKIVSIQDYYRQTVDDLRSKLPKSEIQYEEEVVYDRVESHYTEEVVIKVSRYIEKVEKMKVKSKSTYVIEDLDMAANVIYNTVNSGVFSVMKAHWQNYTNKTTQIKKEHKELKRKLKKNRKGKNKRMRKKFLKIQDDINQLLEENKLSKPDSTVEEMKSIIKKDLSNVISVLNKEKDAVPKIPAWAFKRYVSLIKASASNLRSNEALSEMAKSYTRMRKNRGRSYVMRHDDYLDYDFFIEDFSD